MRMISPVKTKIFFGLVPIIYCTMRKSAPSGIRKIAVRDFLCHSNDANGSTLSSTRQFRLRLYVAAFQLPGRFPILSLPFGIFNLWRRERKEGVF